MKLQLKQQPKNEKYIQLSAEGIQRRKDVNEEREKKKTFNL